MYADLRRVGDPAASMQPGCYASGRDGVYDMLQGPHPKCPEMTLKSLQGGCQTGRGHLLGNRFATAALGAYSL